MPHYFAQHGAADAAAAFGSDDRHSPYMPVRQQTSGADGCAGFIQGKHMNAQRIHFIPFQFRRNALLHDEHFLADQEGISSERRPVTRDEIEIHLTGCRQRLDNCGASSEESIAMSVQESHTLSATIFHCAPSLAQYCRLRTECRLLPIVAS